MKVGAITLQHPSSFIPLPSSFPPTLFAMKIILLFVILFFAAGVMMALVARLSQTQQRLADLHKQLGRNEDEMNRHRLRLEEIAARQEADKRDDV